MISYLVRKIYTLLPTTGKLQVYAIAVRLLSKNTTTWLTKIANSIVEMADIEQLVNRVEIPVTRDENIDWLNKYNASSNNKYICVEIKEDAGAKTFIYELNPNYVEKDNV